MKVPSVLPVTTTRYRYREDDDTNKIYKRILYCAKNKLQKGKEMKMVNVTVVQSV